MRPLQVVFLTGQSDPRSCALSPEQSAFLDALPVPEEARVRLNFPYEAGLAAYRPVPLWRGSLRHAVLAGACHTRTWRARHRPPVLAQLSAASRTVVLAGSIGLHLLECLALPAAVLGRLDVFAYGPVGSGPACRTFRVAGRRDHLSRGPADVRVDGGHLDYLGDPQVLRLATQLVVDSSMPR